MGPDVNKDMRDDLLHAQASVDWAVAQLPGLQARIDSWLPNNFEIVVREAPPPATNDVIVALLKQALPLSFNVEAGAYINAIRSGLDILATTLAYRYRIPKSKDAYFPVAKCRDAFKAAKFVKRLPSAARVIIEKLQPYHEGNDLLGSLHHLDIVRKHRRLLGVEAAPESFMISTWGDTITPVATGWMRANDEIVLALVRK